MQAVSRKLADLPPIRSYEPEPVPLEEQVVKAGNEFSVHEEDGVYTVEADWLGQVLGSVNMDDLRSLQYFQRVLINSGINCPSWSAWASRRAILCCTWTS